MEVFYSAAGLDPRYPNTFVALKYAEQYESPTGLYRDL